MINYEFEVKWKNTDGVVKESSINLVGSQIVLMKKQFPEEKNEPMQLFDADDNIFGIQWLSENIVFPLKNTKSDREYVTKSNISKSGYRYVFDKNPDIPLFLIIYVKFQDEFVQAAESTMNLVEQVEIL